LHIVCYSPGGVLVAADYSQLELRVIAHLSADRKLLGILNTGGDVFKLIASQWKMVDIADVTAEQRQQAKQVLFETVSRCLTDLPLPQIFPPIDSLPASGLTPRTSRLDHFF